MERKCAELDSDGKCKLYPEENIENLCCTDEGICACGEVCEAACLEYR